MHGLKKLRGVRGRHESLGVFPESVKQKGHYPAMN